MNQIFASNLSNYPSQRVDRTDYFLKDSSLSTVVSYQMREVHKMRAANVAPLLPRFMKEGERKKAALILMKHSQFEKTLQ